MVCIAWLLVVGGQVKGSRLCVQDDGYCTTLIVCVIVGVTFLTLLERKVFVSILIRLDLLVFFSPSVILLTCMLGNKDVAQRATSLILDA